MLLLLYLTSFMWINLSVMHKNAVILEETRYIMFIKFHTHLKY